MYNGFMNYKQVAIALVILAGLLVVVSFWPTTPPKTAPVVQEQVLAGTLSSAGDYEYAEDEKYYTVKASYPAETGLSAEADAKARLTIERSLADRIAEFKKNGGLNDMTAENAAIQNLGGDRKYALDLKYKKFTAPDSVSYLYTVYEDTGGAHPNTYFMTFVFDKQGNKMELAQLFPSNPKWLEELALLVSNDVVSQYKARAQVEDTTGLLFNEGLAPKAENFSNFVLDGNSLAVYLPPYQVAAYAAGSFEVKIPLKDLQ